MIQPIRRGSSVCFGFFSRKSISAPTAITAKPNRIFSGPGSTLFSRNAPAALPASSSAPSGRISFGKRRFFPRQARIALDGNPSSSSTGVISKFAAPKLRIEVKTSVLAKPHRPLMKKAQKAAANQISMGQSSLPPGFSGGCSSGAARWTP